MNLNLELLILFELIFTYEFKPGIVNTVRVNLYLCSLFHFFALFLCQFNYLFIPGLWNNGFICLVFSFHNPSGKVRPRLFAGKWFLFGKWIPGKVNSWKLNFWKVNFDVWQCYGKWTGKHFSVFVCVMENKLENNLLIIFFSSLLK